MFHDEEIKELRGSVITLIPDQEKHYFMPQYMMTVSQGGKNGDTTSLH